MCKLSIMGQGRNIPIIHVGPSVNRRFPMRQARRSKAEKQDGMIEVELRLLKTE